MKMKMIAVTAALAGMAAFLPAQDKQLPPASVPKGKGISAKEAAAIKKISDAKSPAERIAAVDALVTNFADTIFKGEALYEAAEAADQMQDFTKAISYGDLSIEADPKSGSAMQAKLLVAGELAQHTGKNDLDKDMKLAKAEKYVNEALEMLPTITKPEGVKISDADWEAFKKDKTSEAHRDLGLIATARQKYDVAATEFKTAVDLETMPDIIVMVRLGNAYNETKNYAGAKAILAKVLATPDLNPQVKQFADQEMNRANAGLKNAK
jgi:tetratricopeptide (TPR) repeat protein